MSRQFQKSIFGKVNIPKILPTKLEEYSYVDVEISPNVLKFIEKYNDDKIKKKAEKVREKALRGMERRIRFCNFFLKVKNAIIVGEMDTTFPENFVNVVS